MPGIAGKLVKKIYANPLAAGLRFDSPDYISAHRRILDTNPVLRAAYRRWYGEILRGVRPTDGTPGDVVELGSGAGFLEESIPELVKTDTVPNPYAPRIENAMNLGFASNSLRALVLVQTFHHLSEPVRFLEQAERCLRPGGRLVLVEPNNSFFEKLLCRILDHYEFLDASSPGWENPAAQSMEGANLAMAWIIFVRDVDRFHARFPKLKLRSVRYHTVLAYVISGGMSYRPFIPAIFLPVLNLFETLTKPLGKWLATSMTIEVEKLP